MGKKICCICGKEFEGWGNNPYPLELKGCCCDDCNSSIVIPIRLSYLNEASKKMKGEK